MTTVPSSPPPPATDPVSGPSVPARLRIVAWMLFVVALGLTSMIVSVRSTLMADISRSANTDVTHEVKELQNFASTGVDPRTSQPFTSTTRLMEVYRDGQQLTDREAVIVYNHATGKATQASGASAPTLDLTSTDPLFVKMLQSPSGATDYGSGEVRWARVELEPDDPSQHLSVITMSFTASRVDQINATIWLMVGISAAVLVLTGVVGLLVARQILRPLRDLRTAAASVSTQDLNRRLPVKGRDDISGLTEEFNGMLDRLQEAFDGQTQFVLRAHQEISGPLAVMDARLASQPATRTVLQQRTQIAELQRVLDDLQSLTQAERRDFAHPTPDVEVTELARTNPLLTRQNGGSLSDPRVEVVNEDAFGFTAEAEQDYDVVLVDLVDPSNEKLAKLYSVELYRQIDALLAADGVMVTQATSSFFSPHAFSMVASTVSAGQPDRRVYPYSTNIPSFGEWGFVLSTRDPGQLLAGALPSGLTYQSAPLLRFIVVDNPPTTEPSEPSTLLHPRIVETYNSDMRQWRYY